MEKDTVVLSLKRYEELTAFEREVMAGKVVTVEKGSINNTVWVVPTDYNSYLNRNDLNVYFLTEDEIVKELSEEIKRLREELKKVEYEAKEQKASKHRILSLLRSLENKRWGKSSRIQRMIDNFWEY